MEFIGTAGLKFPQSALKPGFKAEVAVFSALTAFMPGDKALLGRFCA
jgi:hypothetical protein